MREFTRQRDNTATDEIWILEHYPVFTLGQAGKREHILTTSAIEIVESDRGGQVTYHCPGQIIFYPLIDLSRRKIGVRRFVELLENSIIMYLAQLNILATSEPKAPGVYVAGKKIAAIGLRVHKGKSYHGISFNINANLKPFKLINPCGYPNLEIINLSDLCIVPASIVEDLTNIIVENINYDTAN
jgi:lipoyl(octanoyl) transferase